jgi:Fe2+ or Zn2+ uptake regulation protein
VGCRKVVDVSDTIAVEVPKSIAGEFAVIGNHIEFYGYCSPCRKKKRER